MLETRFLIAYPVLIMRSTRPGAIRPNPIIAKMASIIERALYKMKIDGKGGRCGVGDNRVVGTAYRTPLLKARSTLVG